MPNSSALLRGFTTGTPLGVSAPSIIARRTSATPSAGLSEKSFAARLATCGLAMLVSLNRIFSPPGNRLAALAKTCVDEAARRGGNVHLILREPVVVSGGRIALIRAIGNLIENAVRYGTRAEVDVTRQNDHAQLTVSDQGPGIAEKSLEQVFEPYYRLEPSRSAATGGFGLGLASTRSIIEAHGGNVRLRNRPQGGLIAIVLLPLHRD